MDRRKTEKWWKPLLSILIILIIDILIFILSALADAKLFSGAEGQGHGMPAITIIGIIVIVIATVIVVLTAIIKTVKNLINRKK